MHFPPEVTNQCCSALAVPDSDGCHDKVNRKEEESGWYAELVLVGTSPEGRAQGVSTCDVRVYLRGIFHINRASTEDSSYASIEARDRAYIADGKDRKKTCDAKGTV